MPPRPRTPLSKPRKPLSKHERRVAAAQVIINQFDLEELRKRLMGVYDLAAYLIESDQEFGQENIGSRLIDILNGEMI